MIEDQYLQGNKNVDPAGRQLSRRDFLKISGSGVFIFFRTGTFSTTVLQPRGSRYPTDFNAYLKIGDDGRVSLFCSKIEMGQGWSDDEKVDVVIYHQTLRPLFDMLGYRYDLLGREDVSKDENDNGDQRDADERFEFGREVTVNIIRL